MDQEVLKSMKNEMVDELLNVIAVRRYVNLFFREGGEEIHHIAARIVARAREAQPQNFCIDIDARAFIECRDEEQEAKLILKLINKELSKKQFNESIPEAISIADAFDKLNARLDRPAIAIFHCFENIYDEKEKDILRSIRTFKGIAKGLLLGILIISNQKINRWELYPESNLDERHVAFFEYPLDEGGD